MMRKTGFSGVMWVLAGLFLALLLPAKSLAVVDVLIDEQKLLASDGTEWTKFGNSVCVDGNTAIIGAYWDGDFNSGAAYMFAWDGNNWIEEAKLTASDGGSADEFGGSVSVSGNYAVVGASNAEPSYGAAYVFQRQAGGWVQQAKLMSGPAQSCFGYAVSMYENRMIVGACLDNDKGHWAGAAYVFVLEGGQWVQEAKLTATDGAADDEFGRAVCIEGDYAIIGAPYDDADTGAAYVFVRSGGSWTQQAKLTASDATGDCLTQEATLPGPDGACEPRIGWYVSLSGDNAIVAGCLSPAYVFSRTGSTWTQQATLLYSDHSVGPVCISGNVVLAANDAGVPNTVHAFVKRGGSWVEVDSVQGGDAWWYEKFGLALSMSGRRCLIGAPSNDENGYNAGAVYAYTWCSPGDLTGDCKVDMEDVAILGLHWLDGK